MKKFLLVLCVFAAACFTPAVLGAQDTWTLIKDKNDFSGNWQGTADVPIPASEELFMPDSSIKIDMNLSFTKNAPNAKFEMKIDMENFITDWIKIAEIQEAGFVTKDDLWEWLSQEFQDAGTIGKYYVTEDLSDSAESFLAEDAGIEMFLNQKKDKIKLIFEETISFGLGDAGFTEIVLSKK